MRSALVVLAAAVALVPAGVARRAPELTFTSRATTPGEVVLVTVHATAPATSVRVRAFDHETGAWAVDDTTWRALVGIDLDTAPGAYRVEARLDGSAAARLEATLDVTPRTFRTRRLTVDPDFVHPPPAVQARIDAEQARLNQVWDTPWGERLWSGAFRVPVPQPANSAFGTRSVFNGEPRSAHGGTDFLSPAGTPVNAPAAGRVRLVAPLYYTGRTVVIDHGLGVFSLFAHLSAFAVAEGARVEAGDLVGKVGATGRVTGPHLHWTTRVNGARIDPLGLVAITSR